jgi:hypothetical protein
MALAVQAQTYNQLDGSGNYSQRNEYGNNGNFNPNSNDTTSSNKEVPYGVRAWTVDRKFGDIIPAEMDTLHHLFQNTIYNTGIYGHYNSTGNNYTARLSRIFIDRPQTSEFFFTDTYDYTTKEPHQFVFMNTLSPYTNITYDNCGDKQHGEDHIEAKFGINANKNLGFGFDLDYHYGMGYYSAQSASHFRTALYSYYTGDKYQMHFLGTLYHRKATENGGIVNDEYITHPEAQEDQYSEEEIPTVLSQNWNRNNSQHFYFSHRYNIGFYKRVPMTEDEIKAREFAEKSAQDKEKREKKKDKMKQSDSGKGRKTDDEMPKGRPADAKIVGNEPVREKFDFANDSTRIKVDTQQKMDSLLQAHAETEDSIDDSNTKKVYVPVTSIIHTVDFNNYSRIYQAYASPVTGQLNGIPISKYYANTFYDMNDENAYRGDSIYDKNKYLSIKNTVALALLEGFNKYMKAGLKAYLAHEYRKYQMPDLAGDSTAYYMGQWTENNTFVGGQISKTQGNTLHFNLSAEFGLTGSVMGKVAADFHTDLNFRLFGDTVTLAANAYFHRNTPGLFLEKYHSKHLWWDQDLKSETRTHVEGIFNYRKTNTQLRVAIDEIQNYTYFGMNYTLDSNLNRTGLTGGIFQESGNINVLTAQLMQNFRLGPLNWENVVTYQNSSNKEVLPLPSLNVFSNLYLKFCISRVLNVELGGCVTYFTKYDAPDFLPMLNQFAVQQNADSRVELGGYPFVDVYANMQLKRARFFIAMSHINAGSGTKMQFLTPHYPMNNRTFRLGVSWTFIN